MIRFLSKYSLSLLMTSRLLAAGMLLIAVALPASAADKDGKTRFPKGLDETEIQVSLAKARNQAREEGRLLMVILGADWCHDSRAFIDYLEDPAFAALIDERYRVERVNVGFYDNVRGVVSAWDLPVIYGTPTVIVEEPISGVVLNRDTLPHWRDAAALGAGETVRYFGAFAPGAPAESPAPSPALADALADIDDFETAQAERIYAAYAEIGQLLSELGDDRPGPDFIEKWDNLAAMRGAITGDLAALRAAARTLDAAGEREIALDFPSYDLFID